MPPYAAPDANAGGFPRWWTEFVADVADHLPGGVAGLALLVLLVAGAVTAALHWWPHRRRRVRRRDVEAATPIVMPVDDADATALPDRTPTELRSLADRYAAEGRYAEAVRERLRAMVRRLVDRGVLEHHPGWTVTELAVAAGRAQPRLAGPMREAADVFSGVWYARRPALAAHDSRMRELAETVERTTTTSGRGGRRTTPAGEADSGAPRPVGGA